MEKENPIIHASHTEVMPPPESHTSVVLNGIGNGVMLGTGPFMALELYSQISEKALDKRFYKGCAFATVVGCALGAVYGIREANKLQDYRKTIGQEIIDLREQLQAQNATIKSWGEKHKERASHAEPELVR